LGFSTIERMNREIGMTWQYCVRRELSVVKERIWESERSIEKYC